MRGKRKGRRMGEGKASRDEVGWKGRLMVGHSATQYLSED